MKIILIITIFCLLHISCAKQVFPTGGEGDKIPPKVVDVSPKDKSVSVSQKTKITVNFSEWVTPKSAENGIIISPNTEFSMKVRGKTVEITPKFPLKENTSYHLSFLSEISDFSNNTLVETQTIIFSTGGFIDTAFIEGRVFFEKSDYALPKIALFFNERANEGDSVLLSMPDYITQADSSGYFKFNCISDENYRIIGFTDKNRDNKITPREQVFISEDQIIKTQIFAELLPATCDTIQNKLHYATAISPNIVIIKSDQTSYDSMRIFSGNDSKNIRIEKIEKVEGRDVTMAIFLEDSLQNQLYVLAAQSQKIFITNGDSIFYDTTKFNGTTLVDTVKLAQIDSSLLPKTEDKIESGNAEIDSVKSDVAVFCPKLSWSFLGELPQNPLWEIKGEKSFLRYTNDNFLENIPVGKYTISLIDDKNQNEKHDLGTLFPFVCGEKKISFPDTLITRERWEVEYDIGAED